MHYKYLVDYTYFTSWIYNIVQQLCSCIFVERIVECTSCMFMSRVVSGVFTLGGSPKAALVDIIANPTLTGCHNDKTLHRHPLSYLLSGFLHLFTSVTLDMPRPFTHTASSHLPVTGLSIVSRLAHSSHYTSISKIPAYTYSVLH